MNEEKSRIPSPNVERSASLSELLSSDNMKKNLHSIQIEGSKYVVSSGTSSETDLKTHSRKPSHFAEHKNPSKKK